MRIELLVDTPEEDDYTYEEALAACRELLGSGYMEIINSRKIRD
jgi:hypothetical protein